MLQKCASRVTKLKRISTFLQVLKNDALYFFLGSCSVRARQMVVLFPFVLLSMKKDIGYRIYILYHVPDNSQLSSSYMFLYYTSSISKKKKITSWLRHPQSHMPNMVLPHVPLTGERKIDNKDIHTDPTTYYIEIYCIFKSSSNFSLPTVIFCHKLVSKKSHWA